MSTKEIVVTQWPKPRGYSNGRIGQGAVLHIAGQIGWDEKGMFADGGLGPQFATALDNVIAVVKAAGGVPEDIATMTVFVTDIEEYRKSQAILAPIWRERLGRHYPAMALVGVSALVEPAAIVEIQAVAYLGTP